MDVPVPSYIKADDSLFSTWGACMMALIKHGKFVTLQRGESLPLSDCEIGLLIDGGLYAMCLAGHDDSRKMMAHFFCRGELFIASAGENLDMDLIAHCRSSCLVLPATEFSEFAEEFSGAPRLVGTIETWLTKQFLEALQKSNAKDIDKIQSILAILASHPTATDTKLGREIEASKQLIRELAGVQKRSSSRAFRTLEESGLVSFYGYKRLFFTGQTNA
tara:strand:- start:9835 stop:10491 length:657 start_codon:yes stop_codon:yes gene_type:complete